MTSLYSPYRAIGYVCDSNAFSVNRLGEEIFVSVSIGSSFQVFRLNKLVACLVSKNAPGKISSIQAIGHETFVAVGQQIIVYDRANIVRKYEAHAHVISGMISVGSTLISYDQANNIKVHDVKERKLVSELSLLQSGSITGIVHPATYVNKFVVGFSNGQLELWNFNSKKLLYTFKSHLPFLSTKRARSTSIGGDSDDEEVGTVSRDGSAAVAVTCLEQSPACDVIGVGFSNGYIVLLNLKLDQVLFSFMQKGGAVTALSFRTDAGAEKAPFLASSSADGRIHIWNLGTNHASDEGSLTDKLRTKLDRKLQSTLEEAHVGAVSKVEFVYGEPIMISTGAEDNSIKVWIFDAPDGSARLLRSREGHRGAPSRIRYYGGTTHVSMRDNADAMSCEMISAGTDGTLRLFNTAIETQNRELSQKPILKKLGLQRRNERLPQCTAFDFSETRQRDWGNLVTIHKDHANAYVWKFKHRVVTEMVLKQPQWKDNDRKFYSDRRTHATAVALSPCGNFAVVGTRGGVMYKYNLQSGIHRGAFPISAVTDAEQSTIAKRSKIPGNIYHDMKVMLGEQATSLNAPKADETKAPVPVEVEQVGHIGEISGIFIDMMGITMVSCGYDGLICFWDFITQKLIHKIELNSPQLLMQGFRDANFFAVAGQDRVIRLYDMNTFKLSRRFAGGHTREITDLAFSPDGRRLLSSALDNTLRVWDLPTGRCLNWLRFDSAIQSMTLSLSGEYLCIAQADKEGIYMYIDKSLYETVHFWREPMAPTPVADCLVLISEGETADQADVTESAFAKKHGGEEESDADDQSITVTASQAQVDSLEGAAREEAAQRGPNGTITMSAIPRAYWTSLFNLEAIKQRNKPIAAPAPPVQAPFFLPSMVRAGGSAPSFPTPAEYAKLTSQLASPVATGTTAAVEDGKKRESNIALDASAPTAKKAKVSDTQQDSAALSEEEVLKELAGMGSAWTDDGDSWGASDEVNWTLDSKPSSSDAMVVSAEETATDAAVGFRKNVRNRCTSKIISKKTQLPRCKLVAYLHSEFSGAALNAGSSTSVLLEYLKKLPPPAVDLEMRALCTHAEDEEGLELLRQLLVWLAAHIATGHDFEVLQAYLHHALSIYAPLITKAPVLSEVVAELRTVHQGANGRFRHLVQKNLCLLKMMGNLPIA